ncbi:hypothetical protein TNCV_4082011 [Trichonephila clavipes]|nr:hypothetical protein TNCV_4082011 [Trichonephila clavipes]
MLKCDFSNGQYGYKQDYAKKELNENRETRVHIDIISFGQLYNLHLVFTVVTPHTAGVEETSLEEYSSVAAENIIKVLEDQSPLTPVS